MLLSLAWIFLLGLALGGLMQKLGLPSLLGMLLTGILLAQLGAIDASLLDISSSLREIALVIILLRAGLNLSVQDLKRAGRPAVLLCFLPAVCEIGGILLLAPPLLGCTRLEAAILGSTLAAVSPAVIVPRMLRLMEEGWGKTRAIPQMIMAGASVDDVFVIVLFTAFTGLAQGGSCHAGRDCGGSGGADAGRGPVRGWYPADPERTPLLRHRLLPQSHGTGGDRAAASGHGPCLRADGAYRGCAGHPAYRAAGCAGHRPHLQTAAAPG